MNVFFARIPGLSAAVSLSLLLLSSCGGGMENEFPVYHVSGKVLYDGKPLPFGSIVFEPDAAKGNAGPQGTATIKDGVYDTRQGGTGCVGGPTVVIIMGSTHEVVIEGGEGHYLFPAHKTTKDLPLEDTTADFEIPKFTPKTR